MAVKPPRIAVLASGRGSNFRALAEAAAKKDLGSAEIVGLLSNKKSAPALEIAKEFGVPNFLVESKKFRTGKVLDRAAFDSEIRNTLMGLKPDWICLAGYMLLLGPELVKSFSNRIVNIHPSLLPKFKGLDAQQQALDAGERETGCTVHLVNEELDDGPTVLQSRIRILPEDTVNTLSERLLPVEHRTYVEAMRLLCTTPFQIVAGRVLFAGKGYVEDRAE